MNIVELNIIIPYIEINQFEGPDDPSSKSMLSCYTIYRDCKLLYIFRSEICSQNTLPLSSTPAAASSNGCLFF